MYENFCKSTQKVRKTDKRACFDALERIRVRPESFLARLVGGPYYKLRVGYYRVVIDLNKKELWILVVRVGHRKNVYD